MYRQSTLLALACSLAFTIPCFSQTTIFVPGDQPTIQAGIDAASNGDTVLVAAGTYVEQIDFNGKAITVASESGAAVTTIDSQAMEVFSDPPNNPVVRFISGEGLGSILDGFTVTGCNQNTCAGIYAIGANPLIRHCIIRDNKGGPGAGVRCDNAVFEDTVITNNNSKVFNQFGGGIYGAPSLTRCTVTNNQSCSEGGGIYTTGSMTIVSSDISKNSSPLCYTGAGIYANSGDTVTLIDTLMTGNTTCQFDILLLREYGAAIGGPGSANLIGCTIANNTVFGLETDPTNPAGAIDCTSTIIDSILYNNLPQAFADTPGPSLVTYTNDQDGTAGTGNINTDPLLDSRFFPTLNAPGTDAGDPAGNLDPDGTRGDMGAFYFPQFLAGSTTRNGSGTNPVCLIELSPAQIGGNWSVQVNTNAHGFSGALSVLVAFEDPLAPLPFAFGELLVDPSSTLLASSLAVPNASSLAVHNIPIPLDYAIGGTLVATQAFVTGGGVGACNALDVTLGL